MPQLCFPTAARLAAKLLFYIESSFLCILSYNANTPLDDVGRNVAKIVHHAMLAGHSRCADYALGCFTPPCVIYNHAGGTLITTNRMFDVK